MSSFQHLQNAIIALNNQWIVEREKAYSNYAAAAALPLNAPNKAQLMDYWKGEWNACVRACNSLQLLVTPQGQQVDASAPQAAETAEGEAAPAPLKIKARPAFGSKEDLDKEKEQSPQ